MKFSSPGENLVVILKVQVDPYAFFRVRLGLSLDRTSPPFSERSFLGKLQDVTTILERLIRQVKSPPFLVMYLRQ